MRRQAWWLMLALGALACQGETDVGEPDGQHVSGLTGADTGGGTDDAPERIRCDRPVNRLDLGTQTLNRNGFSRRFEFRIPNCATAFMMVIEGPDDVILVLDELTSPSGELWIQGPFPQGQFDSPVRMSFSEGVATALVSNSDQPFEPGTFEARIQGGTLGISDLLPYQGEVDVEVLWKGVDTYAEGGAVDVNLYLTGAFGLTAETTPTDTVVQGALAQLGQIYLRAGIELGEVRYNDIPPRFATVTSLDGPDNMLSEMFALSSDSPGGLNFFFIDRFDALGGLGAGIGGISGGVPGPALRPGSPRSGVAVALQATRNTQTTLDPAILAHVMAHEGGHYLGLFHTIEFFGGADPLSDTPEGAESSTNLMFPTVGGDSMLTDQQSQVMHKHPEVVEAP